MPDENKPAVNPPPVPPVAAPPPMIHDASVSPPPPMVEKEDNQDAGIPPVIITSGKGSGKKSGTGKRVIVTLLGLFVLVGGIAAGVILVQRQQDIREKAAYCAICAPADSCECIDGKQNGMKCKFAPPECADKGYTWQPDSSCEKDKACGGGNGNGGCTDPTCDFSSDSSSGCLSATNCKLCGANNWAVQKSYCRGPKTNGNCQKCVDCNPSNPLNCDLGCSCPGANPNTCYDHGDYYTTGNDPGTVCATLDCGNTQTDVGYIKDGSYTYLYNVTWQDGREWSACEEAPPEETASCDSCKVYNEDWEEISLTDITVDQTVYFATLGSSVPDGLITKARFKIKIDGVEQTPGENWCIGTINPSSEWCETTTEHDTYGYYVQYTIPSAGTYNIESQVYAGQTLGWR